MQLLDLIKSLPVNHVTNHPPMVLYTDIYQACSSVGLNNSQLLQSKLIALEKNYNGPMKLDTFNV